MGILDGIEVRVRLKQSGRFLDEYNNPQASASIGPYLHEAFIEAMSAETFEVVLSCSSDFKFFSANGLRMSLSIDDGSIVNDETKYIASKEICADDVASVIDTSVVREGDTYKIISFAFSQLKQEDGVKVEEHLLDIHSSKQGRIVVHVTRCSCYEFSEPRVPPTRQ